MKTRKKMSLHKETLKYLGSVGGTFLPPTTPCRETFEAPTSGFTEQCSNRCL